MINIRNPSSGLGAIRVNFTLSNQKKSYQTFKLSIILIIIRKKMINISNPNRMQHKSKKICSEERKQYITDSNPSHQTSLYQFLRHDAVLSIFPDASKSHLLPLGAIIVDFPSLIVCLFVC